jgi:nucleotide-binding universal stress UspA family protein
MNERKVQERKVLAAIDDSAAAAPVLTTAKALARLFDASIEAVHVQDGGLRVARQTARRSSVPFNAARGPVTETLVRLASQTDVVAVAIGARRTPGGRRPVGGTTLELITAVDKPIAVVPPDATTLAEPRRMLVAANGTQPTAPALAAVVRNAVRSDVVVAVLHVYDETEVPLFEDQPQHERAEREREFIARCGLAPGVTVSFRVGRPGAQVLDESTRDRADLLILAWHRDLSAGRATVVREVLEGSTIPVLLLPVARPGHRTPVRFDGFAIQA